MAIGETKALAEIVKLARIVERAFETEADDAFIEQLRAYVAEPVTGLVAEAQKHAERGAHQVQSALDAYDKAEDKPLWRDYLDASYAELLLGVTPKAIAPVESCYRTNEKVLYAEQFFQVKEVMEEVGFAKPAGFHEPEDHIAMEYALVLYLLEKGDQGHLDAFVSEHLSQWGLQALSEMIDRDDVGFYTGIANLARAVLIELS